MTDRFLGIGINRYPNAPLRGCVPDIRACCDMLVDLGWDWQSMRSCTDLRANRLAIWRRMEWLVGDCKPGDRLLMWFSGHGAQVPERNSGEVDGLTEVLCPVDFTGDDKDTWLRDDDFVSVLRKVPRGVNCIVVLDSCFSGGMVDINPNNVKNIIDVIDVKNRSYPIEQNVDFEIRMKTANAKGLKAKPFIRAEQFPNVAFVLGCQEDQTCADAYLSGGYRGAFSFYLCDAIRKYKDESLSSIVNGWTKDNLKLDGFSQVPQLIGPPEITEVPFMVRL